MQVSAHGTDKSTIILYLFFQQIQVSLQITAPIIRKDLSPHFSPHLFRFARIPDPDQFPSGIDMRTNPVITKKQQSVKIFAFGRRSFKRKTGIGDLQPVEISYGRLILKMHLQLFIVKNGMPVVDFQQFHNTIRFIHVSFRPVVSVVYRQYRFQCIFSHRLFFLQSISPPVTGLPPEESEPATDSTYRPLRPNTNSKHTLSRKNPEDPQCGH